MFEDVGYEDVIFVGLGLGMLGAVAGGLIWAHRRAAAREKWEAAHPYPEVEKPAVPRRFRFVDVDELDAERLKKIDEIFAEKYGRPRAGENDPQVGDIVAAHIVYAKSENGGLVQAPVLARVLWPRMTYVRALMLPAKTRVLDIPRTALAGAIRVGYLQRPAGGPRCGTSSN